MLARVCEMLARVCVHLLRHGLLARYASLSLSLALFLSLARAFSLPRSRALFRSLALSLSQWLSDLDNKKNSHTPPACVYNLLFLVSSPKHQKRGCDEE